MAYTTIDKPDDYFNTVLYTGDGTSSNAITGTGFQPDFVWIKGRSTAYVHLLHDVVRGQSGGEYLYLKSNATSTEQVVGDGSGLLSLDTDGFTVGEVGNATWNNSGTTYASWNWLADNTSGSSNSDGSITSTVSANTTSGFSIVSYSGDGGSSSTVGHGLGAIPKLVIIKCRTSTPSWQVWGEGYTRLSLNNLDGNLTSFGMTRGASTVTLPSGINDWNGSGQDYIMYCWSEVKGFSKFSTYTGNGSTDGTFIYTGFKPAWVIVKRISASGDNWIMFDNKRDEFNVTEKKLEANDPGAEATTASHKVDFLSNGFKMRAVGAGSNASGSTYMYMVFAENPFVTSTGIPATAR